MTKSVKLSWLALLTLCVLDLWLWSRIVGAKPLTGEEFHFLDVGQGDAQLLILPSGVKILTDAGPDEKIGKALQTVLPSGDRYLDMAVISHPQLDHFGGLIKIVNAYDFGAVLVSGRDADESIRREWNALLDVFRTRAIPIVAIGEGDKIRVGSATVNILSPGKLLSRSAESNDTGIVQLIETRNVRALLTADIGFGVEKYLLEKYDLAADILKIGHHGSRYSSGDDFLSEVRPAFAVIQSGAGNRYGHPTEETLKRIIKTAPLRIFRNDQDGTISGKVEDGRIVWFTSK